MTTPGATAARPHCYRCDKPLSMCLCAHLRPIPNRVGVHILQHPRERRHALGTARLLRLGLARVQVHVLDLKGTSAASTPVKLPVGAGLLYPSKDARELTALQEDERPAHLVVIDGTWAHANRIYRDNPWVSALPHYRLSPEEGSRYRIRPEPRLECLSTLESVVAALRCLEPQLRGTETLDRAFDAMIDGQIAASARTTTQSRFKRTRDKPPQAVPECMLAPGARVIIVYAEAAPLRVADPGPRQPIRLSAMSLDGGRVFDQILLTRPAPDATEAAHMGLVGQDLASATPMDQAMVDFRAFCAADPSPAPVVLVSWGTWTQRWLEREVADLGCVFLKGVWANVSQERIPALDALVAQLGLVAPAPPVRGRAGRRLSDACAMARHILEGARPDPVRS